MHYVIDRKTNRVVAKFACLSAAAAYLDAHRACRLVRAA